QTLTLWVLEINAGARAFYRDFGFIPDGGTKVDELTTERLVAFRYRIDLKERPER
ncbi:MAG: GNAT family N-acetyltransferase, partial [Gammaproteobacteria bacterium]|nr:GNAT family N-acetyltransferase [Gemmatimonadota bacterium]NIR34582.1 GNAT family N-acetyltransferase [Actinomycetota bacterium]NIU72169.1 GNAT family N-acetyltransferase [Gammaproteobacteria bacterium]NIY06879.1 GNAT family N-acetyltransferase [Gemmatimonadota bacterium]